MLIQLRELVGDDRCAGPMHSISKPLCDFKLHILLMKKVILHISGNVQQARFRTKAVAIVNALDITGNIQNLPDGRVKIIAEGEDADLERFIKGINIKNTLIYVSDIAKEYSTPTGDYEYFYKLVKDGETDERLDTAAEHLKELIHVTKNGFGQVCGKIDDLGGKIDGVSGKIDGVSGKIDGLGGKIDQSRIETTSEIHALRDDFKSHIDARLSNVESEIGEIKAKIMLQ